MGALLGVLGSIFSNKKSARQQTSIEPKEYAPLRDMLLQQAQSRLQPPSELMPGYEATGIRNINTNSDLARQSLENRLGASGLLGSGVHGAGLTSLETRRFGDINDLQNIELPQLLEQLYGQRQQQALGVYNQRVPGTQLPGSAVGSALTTASELLAYLYGSGALGGGEGAVALG